MFDRETIRKLNEEAKNILEYFDNSELIIDFDNAKVGVLVRKDIMLVVSYDTNVSKTIKALRKHQLFYMSACVLSDLRFFKRPKLSVDGGMSNLKIMDGQNIVAVIKIANDREKCKIEILGKKFPTHGNILDRIDEALEHLYTSTQL